MPIVLTPAQISATIPQMSITTKSMRELSWVYCHQEFMAAHTRRAYRKRTLSLHLVGFLASFGMYCRRAPLFLQQHYLVHEDLIPILMQTKYAPLFSVHSLADFRANMPLMCEVYKEIKKYYAKKSFLPSETLITKIMLGVYGCVPALDTQFLSGMKKAMIPKSVSFLKTLQALALFLSINPTLDTLITSAASSNPPYTYMRVFDDFLWHF